MKTMLHPTEPFTGETRIPPLNIELKTRKEQFMKKQPRGTAATGSGERTPSAPQPIARPTQEPIAARAHEIYLRRGGAPGRELDEWLQAERELKTELGEAPL